MNPDQVKSNLGSNFAIGCQQMTKVATKEGKRVRAFTIMNIVLGSGGALSLGKAKTPVSAILSVIFLKSNTS